MRVTPPSSHLGSGVGYAPRLVLAAEIPILVDHSGEGVCADALPWDNGCTLQRCHELSTMKVGGDAGQHQAGKGDKMQAGQWGQPPEPRPIPPRKHRWDRAFGSIGTSQSTPSPALVYDL
jgi:hypothetical protein